MRKIVANTFITLDGVMQAPGGSEEDPTGDFKHGGWSVNYWDDMMAKTIMKGLIGKPFDLLLGRRTYEIFAAHWPFVKNDPDKLNAMAADKLNGARKYVVSKTPCQSRLGKLQANNRRGCQRNQYAQKTGRP